MAFVPLQILNCEAWWDATDPRGDGSTQFSDGQAMGFGSFSWIDKANARELIQSSVFRPLYKTDILNGNPVVRFDGVNDYFNMPSALHTIPNDDSTVFIVAKSSGTNAQNLLSMSTDSGTVYGINYGKADIPESGYGLMLALTNPIEAIPGIDPSTIIAGNISDDTAVHLNYVTIDAFNTFTYAREATLQTFAVNAYVTEKNYLGADVSGVTSAHIGSTMGTSDFFEGDIAEILIYSRKLTGDETRQIEEYLGDKWGIYVHNAFRNTAMALAGDRLVKLYEIDATNIGGDIYRFVSSVDTTMNIVSLHAAGYYATVVTENPHALSSFDPVRVFGAEQTLVNGDFLVQVQDPVTFTYQLPSFTEDFVASSLHELKVTRLNNTVLFGGKSYIPVAFEAEGFEWTGQGSLPQPKIRISNVNKLLLASVISLNDMMGAKFTRIRTFRKFLDDGSTPDTASTYPKEIYKINRKSIHNKIYLEFELASPMDQEGVMLPNRQCLKNMCTQRYRNFDAETGTFDYTNATCPYTANSYFKANNNSTSSASEDRCGKNLDSCKRRFGTAPLPTRAFPGIGG
jgi:lambda family phage minor tail protein L